MTAGPWPAAIIWQHAAAFGWVALAPVFFSKSSSLLHDLPCYIEGACDNVLTHKRHGSHQSCAQCFRANEKWSWATHMQPPLLTRNGVINICCMYLQHMHMWRSCTSQHWCCKLLTDAHPFFTSKSSWGHKGSGGYHILLRFSQHWPILYLAALNYLLHELRLQHLHDLRLQLCWHEGLEGIDLIWESLQRPTIILTSGSSVVRVVYPQCPEVVFCRTPITVVRLGDLKCQAHHFLFMFFFVTVDEHHCTGIIHWTLFTIDTESLYCWWAMHLSSSEVKGSMVGQGCNGWSMHFLRKFQQWNDLSCKPHRLHNVFRNSTIVTMLQVPKGHQMAPGPISIQTQGDSQTVAVQLNLEHVNFHDVFRKACNINWIASFVLRSSCRLLICIHCMWLTIRMFFLITDKNAKQVLQLRVSRFGVTSLKHRSPQ